MIRRKDEMEASVKHEVQKGMGDVTFHPATFPAALLKAYQ